MISAGNSFGFLGKGYALLCSDSSIPRSIIVMKSYDDKILQVAPKTLFALTGEVGDRKNFGEFIQRNIKWYEMRNNRSLNNKAIANFTRNELSNAIRRNPYVCWVLQAGYDEEDGPSLYWMDYFGALAKPKTAAQGLCAYFLLSLFDRHWKENMNIEEGIALVKKCIHQLHQRFLIAEGCFIVKIVSKDGVQQINLNKKFVIEEENKNIDDELDINSLIPEFSKSSIVNAGNDDGNTNNNNGSKND